MEAGNQYLKSLNISDLQTNLILSRSLIVICGPTASGKTDLAIDLANRLNTEVISADSRQIYKYLDIGTAKPSKTELQSIKHHFIDTLNPDENYSAGQFGDEAEKIAIDLLNSSKIPIVAGGSGLYIKSLCEGLFKEEKSDTSSEIRFKLNEDLKNNGIEKLYNELKIIDEKSALKYSDKNPRRILRALEYYQQTGRTISQDHNEMDNDRDFQVHYFAIDYPRELLYDRINQRTEIMWNIGLVEETKNLLNKGYSEDLNSLNTVGYKEAIQYLKGNFSKDSAISEIKKNTRRYAKRQLTWYRAVADLNWINYQVEDKSEFVIQKLLDEFKL